MSQRRFPFGRAPAVPVAPPPDPPPRMTEPLVGFVPPGRVLPFRPPRIALPPAPPAPPAWRPYRAPPSATPRRAVARWVLVVLVVFAIDAAVVTALLWRP